MMRLNDQKERITLEDGRGNASFRMGNDALQKQAQG